MTVLFRMRAIFRLALIALAMLSTTHWAAGAAQPALPRLGDYLDTAYATVLRKSGSPRLAAADDTRLKMPQFVSVQADAAGRRIALDYGWREGRMLLVLRRNGQMFRQMAWRGPGALALRLAPSGDLCLAARDGRGEHCYSYVGDARRFVMRATMVGRWRDRQGQTYWFSADGRAHFPGYDFGYTLALDRGALGYDCFQVEESGRVMAFRRAGAVMTLFAVARVPDFRQPVAVLLSEEGSSPFLKKRTKKLLLFGLAG